MLEKRSTLKIFVLRLLLPALGLIALFSIAIFGSPISLAAKCLVVFFGTAIATLLIFVNRNYVV